MKANLACLLFIQIIACIMHNSVEARCRGDDDTPFYDEGVTVRVTCESGYQLQGSPSITCTNGEWVPPEPTCRRICSRPGPLSSNLNFRPSESRYLQGDTITYSCNNGYILRGTVTATCTNSGFRPSEIPECKRICSRPGPLSSNLNFRPSESRYIEGNTITYSCNEGYTHRGPVTATCTDSGFNPSEIPECKRKCRNAQEVWDDGKTVHFSCKTGYQLQGSSTATCRDGEWVPPKPTCRRICIRPTFFNFDLKIRPSERTYLEGDNITYSCKEGQRLQGPMRATCTNTGYFSPREVPQCEDNLQCHTRKQTVCQPKSSECNTYSTSKDNVKPTVETCNDDVRLCFIYQFGVQGDSVTVNTTTSGCVNDLELGFSYGCYDRSYLEKVDSSGADNLEQLEDRLNTGADNVTVCFCDRDACNESPETAARNDATAFPFQAKMMLESFIVCLLYWK